MKLKLSKGKPSEISVGSARTCYSSKLVTPEENINWARKDDLLEDLFKSGHHTTMQHSNFTFQIEGMSRLLIWRLLHSHAFYNSDQISQRYAKIKPENDNFYYPKSFDNDFLQSYYQKSFDTYTLLKEKLTKIYELSSNKIEAGIAEKKAMENARYVLPQSVKANLYHTINSITALRYIASAYILPEADEEAKEFSLFLENILIELDSSFLPLIEKAKKQKIYFPEPDLSMFPKLEENEYTNVFDIISGYGVTNYANYAEGLMIPTIFHSNELMGGFSSRMKISLSADAQNQRHRTSPALRPILFKEFLSKSNSSIQDVFYIPDVFKENEEVLSIYLDFLNYSKNILLSLKDNKDISYLIPNAFFIEIIEKNDFSNFIHKAKMRTCLNAQEEIRKVTENQISLLEKNDVEETFYFCPPCVTRFRNNIKPYCTEGSRFCGIPVWKKEKTK